MSSNFHNIATEKLIYEYDELDLQLKAIEIRLKKIKEELLNRNPNGFSNADGKDRIMHLKKGKKTDTNTKKLREDLGDDIWKSYQTEDPNGKWTITFAPKLVEIGRAA